jgi:hypothetical protein
MKPTGPGKFFIKIDKESEVIRLWLYNFDIDGATVKGEHRKVLTDVIGPAVRDGGQVKVLGLASTTASAEHDLQLGDTRMNNVIAFLREKFGAKFVVGKHHSLGKLMALAFDEGNLPGGTKDDQESEVWRAVVLNAWNRGLEPPPPKAGDVPFNNSTWADTTGKVVDRVSMALGIIDFIADIAEVSSVASVTGPLGLFISAVQTIIALPLTWASADALANFNGQIQGAADAIQDMADQFASPGLDLTPMSSWPTIHVPDIHGTVNPQPSASQTAWHAGQIAGRNSAVQSVIDMETNPKPTKLPSGKIVRISGRLWLRAMSKKFGDNVGVEVVIKPTNEELKQRGKPPWPTR